MAITATQPLSPNQLMKGVKSVTSPRVNKKQLTPQQQYVKESLTRALNEVQEAKRTGKTLMSADVFLNEMLNEDSK